MSPERALWGAVVNQGIVEALWPRTRKHGNSSGVSGIDKDRARRWIGSRDFRTVCFLAGYDPEFVANRVTPLLDDPEKAQAFIVRLNGHMLRCGRKAVLGNA